MAVAVAAEVLKPLDVDLASCARRPDLQLQYRRCAIQRLPDELLVYAFQLAAEADDDLDEACLSPQLTVSHVCSRWRQVALSAGTLWTDITLHYPITPSKIARVSTWLSRSQAHGLDICLDVRDPSWDWDEDSHNFTGQDMYDILHLLLPHASRWKTLELLSDTWSPIFAFLSRIQDIRSVPQLRRVALCRCNAYFAAKGECFRPTSMKQPMALFGGLAMPALRELSLSGVHLDWTKSVLRHLNTLEFKYHASEVMPSLAEFIDILAACPLLERLAVVGWGPQLTRDESQFLSAQRIPVRFFHLRQFHFGFLDVEYATRFLSLLALPPLEYLSLEDVSATLNPLSDQDASQLLRCLESCISEEGCASISILNSITSIELHGIRAEPKAFATFLSKCSSLRKLSLMGTSAAALLALLPQGASIAALPCPALQELTCRYLAMGDIVKAVVGRARAEPLPLDVFVHSNGDEEVEALSDMEYAALSAAGARLLVVDDCVP